MPNEPTHQVKFFIYIVESPSPIDLYHRRTEADILRQTLQLNGILCHSVTAINGEAFDASLSIGLQQAMQVWPEHLPIIHISAHGNGSGIQLSSGDMIPWAILREKFRPINVALKHNLIVCMSTCEGYSGSIMAMHPEDSDFPFFAIVGCTRKPTWPETAVAFSSFYHLLANGRQIPSAVEAMHHASGNDYFFFETAENARNNFIDYLNKAKLEEAQRQIEVVSSEEPTNALAKLLIQNAPTS